MRLMTRLATSSSRSLRSFELVLEGPLIGPREKKLTCVMGLLSGTGYSAFSSSSVRTLVKTCTFISVVVLVWKIIRKFLQTCSQVNSGVETCW